MTKQLQKAIDLAARTGDKIIVVDEKRDQGMVIMSLEDYEDLLPFEDEEEEEDFNDLTEDELLDKINREITFNKSADEVDDEIDDAAPLEGDFLDSENDGIIQDALEEKEDVVTDENLYYYEEALVPTIPVVQEEINVPLAKEEIIDNVVKDEKETIDEVAKEEEEEEVEDGFTSVGEELKNRNHWEIPKSIKNSATEIK